MTGSRTARRGSAVTLPDALTVSRAVVAPALPFLVDLPVPFVAVLAWCALSDVLDGALARRSGTASDRGAGLDSAADAVLTLALLVAGARALGPDLPGFVPAVAVIALVRAAGMVVCRVRHGRVVLLHSWANRAAGTLVTVGVLVVVLTGRTEVLVAACVVAAVSAVEELAVHVVSTEADPDRRSLLRRSR